MGIKNKISDGYLYFVTMTVVDWVDVFTRPSYKNEIVNALKHCQQKKGLELYAWCLMTNHLHLIVSAAEGHNLSDILRDFKKHTNKSIIRIIKEEPESRREWLLDRLEFSGRYNPKIKNYKFWQDGNDAKEIHSNEFLDQKIDYIHRNPVATEIVSEPEHYWYSSARNYAGEKGLIDVLFID
ncbi:REP-associated tyrosine transposase [Marinoscillum pacificum]|uniref:REP-associated tyrosine transposase n=1 Tax=Marinoscillum pacificum TaxID=392723 RepID=UPI002157FA32|nr:transposase [Marinoscillum pacificum]